MGGVVKPEKAQLIWDLFAAGKTRADVAAAMGLDVDDLPSRLAGAREIMGRDLPGHGARQHSRQRGHSGHAPPEKLVERRARLAALDNAPRCPTCHLLLPHYDCIVPRRKRAA